MHNTHSSLGSCAWVFCSAVWVRHDGYISTHHSRDREGCGVLWTVVGTCGVLLGSMEDLKGCGGLWGIATGGGWFERC